MSRTIEKKVLAEYYEKIASGEKTFELRLADWDCRSGDILVLNEIDPDTRELTGRSLRRQVGFVGRTKDFTFWTKKEIDMHGYQIISLLTDETS